MGFKQSRRFKHGFNKISLGYNSKMSLTPSFMKALKIKPLCTGQN